MNTPDASAGAAFFYSPFVFNESKEHRYGRGSLFYCLLLLVSLPGAYGAAVDSKTTPGKIILQGNPDCPSTNGVP